MKKSILILILLIFQLAVHSQSCSNYRIRLSTNSNNSDWYGNSIAVKINNVIVAPDVTLNQGQSYYDYIFPVNNDDVISVLFKRNGSYANRCKYEIFDDNNILLATRDGFGTGSSGGPENVLGLLACPSGMKCGTYKIEMFDYYGNGWGGSFMEVYINGILEVTGTFENLSYAWADTEDISFSVESGDSVDIIWLPDPNDPFSFYNSFISYNVLDQNDSLLSSVVSFDTNGLAATYGLAPCPNIPPTVDFSVSSASSCSGQVDFFDASSNNPTQWFWDFGDGNTSILQNPSHTYLSSGSYTVSLTATNISGNNTAVISNCVVINLNAIFPIATSCYPATLNGSLGFGITNVNLGNLNRFSGDAAEGYSDFTCDSTALYMGQSYPIAITHNNPTFHQCAVWIDFNNDGVFDNNAEKVVSSSSSLETTGNVQIPPTAVVNLPLRMRVWADYDLGAQPDPCSSPQFGQVEDYTIYILENTSPPLADFENSFTYTCDGVVEFTDVSANVPFAWNWDFGDGSSSVAQNPTHTYVSDGLYDVSLITYNQYGSDTILKPALVEVNTSNALGSPACSPSTLSACCGYGINKVVFNSINNSSLSAVEGYVDFSCENQTTVNAGSIWYMSIFTGHDNPQDTKVWLDLNNDGFFDNDELLLESYNEYDPSGNIFIPTSATANVPLRLRVSTDEVGNGFGPCDDLFRGQAEDYAVIVNSANDIKDVTSFDFKLYPNPSNGFVTIAVAKNVVKTVSVYNLTGQKVVGQAVQSNASQINLNLKSLNSGSYLVELINDNGFRAVKTLVVQ